VYLNYQEGRQHTLQILKKKMEGWGEERKKKEAIIHLSQLSKLITVVIFPTYSGDA
jgi:hypothetical protein